jgi:hypothetical protein
VSYVAEYTKAILFLGTPHRGSSFGVWGWLAAQALQPLGSNPLILANLEYDSISLLDLHRQFEGVTRDDLRVFNFFEQRPIEIFRLWFIRWQQFVSMAGLDGVALMADVVCSRAVRHIWSTTKGTKHRPPC